MAAAAAACCLAVVTLPRVVLCIEAESSNDDLRNRESVHKRVILRGLLSKTLFVICDNQDSF